MRRETTKAACPDAAKIKVSLALEYGIMAVVNHGMKASTLTDGEQAPERSPRL